ncbi:MAG: AMIN domain-containing protein [Acidobacteriota bacterium]
MAPALLRSRVVPGLALVAGMVVHAGAAPREAPGTVIRSVQTAAAGTALAVTIHADGPLPSPVVGVLDGPPRLYLDFPGVGLRLDSPPAAAGAGVRGIRAALNRPSPPVVRVVLDLDGQIPHRIDASARALGTVTVFLGDPAAAARPTEAPAPPASSVVSAAAAPAAALPPAAAPAARALPRSKDAERYVNQVSTPLGRLNALRPSIAAIASDAAPSPADLLSVAVELDAIRGTLRAMKAPAALATTHDLLMRFCALAFRAAHLRIDPGSALDPEALRNAASAAAGALIVLDRASQDLGYLPPQ